MVREALGEFEHQVLLALLLEGRGRTASVVLELEARTGRTASPAAVFVALRRLEARGYVRSRKRDAAPGEGGRGRREFEVTAAGMERLRDAKRTFERLWGALDPVIDR